MSSERAILASKQAEQSRKVWVVGGRLLNADDKNKKDRINEE